MPVKNTPSILFNRFYLSGAAFPPYISEGPLGPELPPGSERNLAFVSTLGLEEPENYADKVRRAAE